jgi:hypothetical protein
MLASAFLMLSWLVPDIASADPVFPFTGLGFMQPSLIAGVLAAPVAGAMTLLALLIPASRRIAPWVGAILCTAALALSTLLGEPALPLSGGASLISTLVGCAAATALLLALATRRWPAHLAAAVFPLGLWLFSLAGVAAGEQSLTFIAPYREAACLWALAATTACCGSLASGRFR